MGELKSLTINGKKYDKWAEEKYELIEQITLTEAVAEVLRTQEPDGTPYCFSAVYVHLFFPAGATVPTLSVDVYDEDGVQFHQWYNTSTKTTDSAIDLSMYKNHGKWEGLCNPLSNSQNFDLIIPYRLLMTDPNHMVNDKNIAKIKVFTGALPAGMVISIYGVRANAD